MEPAVVLYQSLQVGHPGGAKEVRDGLQTFRSSSLKYLLTKRTGKEDVSIVGTNSASAILRYGIRLRNGHPSQDSSRRVLTLWAARDAQSDVELPGEAETRRCYINAVRLTGERR
ncbi:hypothetical protein XENTR_v10016688 [Xenopus tropicalis]|nr:hypothetical protein XENTR_v10016688 [Xenopus tropicalis]